LVFAGTPHGGGGAATGAVQLGNMTPGEQPGTERYDSKQRQTRGKEVFETPGIDAWAGIGFF